MKLTHINNVGVINLLMAPLFDAVDGDVLNVAFNVTTDWLIFEEEDQRTIQSLIDGMILKHQTKQMVSNLGS